MIACMELVGFGTSNKVKNHCTRVLPLLVREIMVKNKPRFAEMLFRKNMGTRENSPLTHVGAIK